MSSKVPGYGTAASEFTTARTGPDNKDEYDMEAQEETKALVENPVSLVKKDPPGWWYKEMIKNADWISVWNGLFTLGVVIGAVALGLPRGDIPIPLAWTSTVGVGFPSSRVAGMAVVVVLMGVLQAVSLKVIRGTSPLTYLASYTCVTLLAIPAMILGYQRQMRDLGLGWAFWALVLSLLTTNVLSLLGVKKHFSLVKVQEPEFLLKIGIVLLAMKLQTIAELGGPGLLVAWVIPPIVLVFTWKMGVSVFKISNPAMAIMLAAATAICGASAATAVAVCINAKREDLTLVIGVVTLFTVAFMVGIPFVVIFSEMDEYVGGAWIGGTIDATAAAIAAAANVSELCEQVSALTKVIQNALIGAVALCVSIYWVTHVENAGKVSYLVLWKRFPKFVLGFVLASAIISTVLPPAMGSVSTELVVDVTRAINTWYFCYAFIGIGLQCDVKVLSKQLERGVVATYLLGQAFDFAITFAAAYFAFSGEIFSQPDIEEG